MGEIGKPELGFLETGLDPGDLALQLTDATLELGDLFDLGRGVAALLFDPFRRRLSSSSSTSEVRRF
jgi:hypothetical protein